MEPQGPERCRLPFSLHSVPPPPDLTPSLVKTDDQCFAGGAFGDVYKCQYLDGSVSREVAVKALRFKSSIDGDTENSSEKMLRRELGIWRRLRHNNVVPFLGIAYGFGMRNTLSLVSSWMSNGTLHKFIAMHGDKLDVEHRLKLLLDVANGLHYLHSLPIVHGDLNTNNVLLDADYTARLADFGYASLVGDIPEILTYLQRSTMRPGALRWAAPEQINPEMEIARTTESDIYSFGCIALQESSRETNVFSGKQPWSEVREELAILLRLLRDDKPGRPESQTMDDVHWDFIQRCWSPPHERPATDTIILFIRRLLSEHSSVHVGEGSTIQAESSPFPARQQTVPENDYTNRTGIATIMSEEALVSDSHSSYQIQRGYSPNFLVVGETGVGKSSVINLIAGEELADISSRASVCTMEAASYDVVLEDDQKIGHHIRLFDTVGLREPSLSQNGYFTAIEKANVLITQLQRTGGIRLLIFCIRGGRISSVTQSNYRLFCDILCQNQVPVAFVITGMENEHPMEGWWNRNAASFSKAKLFCTSHVCVTSTRGLNGAYARGYAESQIAIRKMLLGHMSRSSWKPGRTWWLVRVVSMLLKWVTKVWDNSKRRPIQRTSTVELAQRLEDECNFDHREAAILADRIWAKRMEHDVEYDSVKTEDAGGRSGA